MCCFDQCPNGEMGVRAQVGASVLSRALSRVSELYPAVVRPEVVVGLDQPDDAALIRWVLHNLCCKLILH